MPDTVEQDSAIDTLYRLQALQDSGDREEAGRLLGDLHAGEVARLFEALHPDERLPLWHLVDVEKRGDILHQVRDEVRIQLIREAKPGELVLAVRQLELDELADIHGDLPKNVTKALLRSMDEQRRERFHAVLSYPEDSAGGLMDTEVAAVRADITLSVALRYMRMLRKRDRLPEDLHNLFVVDSQNHYQGVLSLADLASLPSDTTVADAMDRDIPAIRTDLDDGAVARLFEDRDLVSVAVIDDDDTLLGRITVDAVVDVIRDEGEHEVMRRAGLDEESDMFAPVLLSSRRRAIWLGINLLTAFLASWVIGRFEETIANLVALAVLMPIVASMGGIAGTQTLTLVTRAMALDQISSANVRSLLTKEMAIGFLNGLLWAVVVGAVASVWFESVALGQVIGAALIINLICAALAGASIPLILRELGVDPALAGGMVLTTVTDVVGFLSFLGLATLFLL